MLSSKARATSISNPHASRLSARASRRSGGHSFIEIGMLSVLVAILAMFCVDIGILLLAATINDAACRDAARAAAQADSIMGARMFAAAALGAHADSAFIPAPVIENTDYHAPVVDPATGTVDKKGPPPHVTVATKLTVKLPAPFLLLGMNFGEDGTITFRQSYRYPIISIGEPTTAQAQSEPGKKDK